MKKIIVLALLLVSTSAKAQVIYQYQPYISSAPVYVAPAPVYVTPPVVIEVPAPVYVAPTSVCHWEANPGLFSWNYVWVCR